MKNSHQVVAAEPCAAFIHFKNDVLVVTSFSLIESQKLDSGYPRQLPSIVLVVAIVDGNEVVHALEAGETHRRRDFVHLCIRAQTDRVVNAAKTEVPHQAYARRQRIVVRDDGAALESVDKLRGMKTENLRLAKISDHAPLVGTVQSVSGIEQELEPVCPGYLRQLVDAAWTTPQVHTKNPGGP